VTDLDPYCALALAATASVLQAAFLREFIYRYLSFRSFLGVDIDVRRILLGFFPQHQMQYTQLPFTKRSMRFFPRVWLGRGLIIPAELNSSLRQRVARLLR